jgi:Zn-dependent protease
MISKFEAKELIKAWAATTLAFGIIIYFEGNSFLFSLFTAFLTVGLGFVAHEMAHRAVARKYHKHAEFRANDMMLGLMILMSFIGFIIAAPGAVFISGFVTKKESGIIAAAGPIANIALAALFLALIPIIPTIAMYGFMINALLAMFNLIPFPSFDGQKILEWNKTAYFIVGGAAVLLNIINIMLPYIAK